jgi:ferric-dicitrate binding protein FerR (iron transport regulator)
MNGGEREHIIYELVGKLLEGTLESAETQELDRWRRARPENEGVFTDLIEIWTLSGPIKEEPSFNTNAAWAAVSPKLKKRAPVIQISRPKRQITQIRWLAIAASILILFSAGWYFLVQRSQIEMDPTQWEVQLIAETEVVKEALEDGTEVDLNEGTRLFVADDFGRRERRVVLEGQAYFEVTPDTERPFIIDNQEFELRVLGTAFNVQAYPDSSMIVIEVTEGKVSVTVGVEDYLLEGGMRLDLNKENGKVQLGETRGDEQFWSDRSLHFRRNTIQEVILLLEYYYGTRIIAENPDILNCELTVSFENEELEDILQILSITLGLEIQLEENVWYISGEGCPGIQ